MRTIAWVSVLGIVVAVAALIVVTSVMTGFNKNYQKRLLKVEPHLIVPIEVNHLRPNDTALIEQIRTHLKPEEVMAIHEFESQDVIIRSLDGAFAGAMAKGLDQNVLKDFLTRLSDSNWLQESAELGPDEVIMGSDLARTLGVFEGDQVFIIPPESLVGGLAGPLRFEKLKVKGLLQSKIADIDQKLIFFARDKALLSLRTSSSREGGLEIFLNHPEQTLAAHKELTRLGFRSETWIERNAILFFALKVEKIAMTTFLALSALITGFSIVSVLVLLLHQKRKDIGILMAMGLSRRESLKTFASMGWILSTAGLIIGLIVGVSISLVLEKYPLDILPDIYLDSTIPAFLSWGTVVFIGFLGIVLSFVAAWLPAWHTVNFTPAEALKK